MEWIKTKDQMPLSDDGIPLLFVFEDMIKKGTYEPYRDGFAWFDDMCIRYATDRVDYWMPLPAPPITLPEPVNHIPDTRKMIQT